MNAYTMKSRLIHNDQQAIELSISFSLAINCCCYVVLTTHFRVAKPIMTHKLRLHKAGSLHPPEFGKYCNTFPLCI